MGSRLRLVAVDGVVLERSPAAGGEIEVRLGACILGTYRPEAHWRRGTALVRQRLAELERIITTRHDGPCDTDDAELYLDVALPHLVALPPTAFPCSPVILWAWALCPGLLKARGGAWLEAREVALRSREHPIRFKADTIAERLNVLEEERTRLQLRTIGAVDRPAAVRKAEVKAKAKVRNRERMRRAREADRQRQSRAPKPASTSALKPWLAEGISRSTWYARRSGSSSDGPCARIQDVAPNPCTDAVQETAA